MADQRFEGRVVIVTGAARGIGKNIAAAFAREGATVVIADRDVDDGPMAASEIGGEFLFTDLAEPGGPQRMVAEAVERHGRLDVLVNNARSGVRASFESEDEESWDSGMNVTARAVFFASRAAILAMEATGGGAVVNIASVAAVMATRNAPVYHAAKAAVVQTTRYLAAHAGPRGSRVNCVLPGFIVQDEHRERYDRDDNAAYRRVAEATQPVGRVGSSDDVAGAVLYFASGEARYVNGQALLVDGGEAVISQTALLFGFASDS